MSKTTSPPTTPAKTPTTPAKTEAVAPVVAPEVQPTKRRGRPTGPPANRVNLPVKSDADVLAFVTALETATVGNSNKGFNSAGPTSVAGIRGLPTAGLVALAATAAALLAERKGDTVAADALSGIGKFAKTGPDMIAAASAKADLDAARQLIAKADKPTK